MEIEKVIEHMRRLENVWSEDRPWDVRLVAGHLGVGPNELLQRLRKNNPMLTGVYDKIDVFQLRLARATFQRELEEEKRSKEVKQTKNSSGRKLITSLYPVVEDLMASQNFERAYKTLIYMMNEAGEFATCEERANWFEEIGRLALKIKRHPNEAASYLKLAVHELKGLGDEDGVQDLLETYEEEFPPNSPAWKSIEDSSRTNEHPHQNQAAPPPPSGQLMNGHSHYV